MVWDLDFYEFIENSNILSILTHCHLLFLTFLVESQEIEKEYEANDGWQQQCRTLLEEKKEILTK